MSTLAFSSSLFTMFLFRTRGFPLVVGLCLLGGARPHSTEAYAARRRTDASPAPSRAQSPRFLETPALVFDAVTVIDVQTGARQPEQRVVIMGNRITAVGDPRVVPIPADARVVVAHGKYLIPGLWDMHVHPMAYARYFYPLYIVNGVTGIRDASSVIPLDTLVLWHRQILAERHIGPPRQLLAGPALDECTEPRGLKPGQPLTWHICVTDAADMRAVVDSLKAAGAGFIKTYNLGAATYFAAVSEARKVGLPVGGHLTAVSAIEASDSGATFIDHLNSSGSDGAGVADLCVTADATVEHCKEVADHFKKNNTWFVPTLTRFSVAIVPNYRSIAGDTILARFEQFATDFWKDSTQRLDLEHGPIDSRGIRSRTTDEIGVLKLMHLAGLPIVSGTDDGREVMTPMPPGFALHVELALYVAEGLTPLEALQTATLNPAKAIHATDSLGTVAQGKLADLVLLDADPLVNIENTLTIRAVVANGRYFDRAALDKITAKVQADVREEER